MEAKKFEYEVEFHFKNGEITKLTVISETIKNVKKVIRGFNSKIHDRRTIWNTQKVVF